MLEVLSLIAQNDLTLATGHVGCRRGADDHSGGKTRGVQRIILTHPLLGPQYTYPVVSISCGEAASLGAYMEIVARNFTGRRADTARVLDAIRLVGPDLTFISSDSRPDWFAESHRRTRTGSEGACAGGLRRGGAHADVQAESRATLIKLPQL